MLDQCHNVEAIIPGQIRSVLTVQEMTARVLLVDSQALAAAQVSGDVMLANDIFMDAYQTDVRQELAEWREGRGLPRDAMGTYLSSGYAEKIVESRQNGIQSGWDA
jgi:L-rhamnose isomerase/sugar isomerase